MRYITVILIGLSLSLDAAAAAAASGACCCQNKKALSLKCAALFSVFQGGMTLAGYALGSFLIDYIDLYAHWVAFGLLSFIGGKMIIDAFHDDQTPVDYSSNKVLIILAVATSIDAFAAGMSLNVEEQLNIYISALIIAAITLAMCLISSKLGSCIGKKLEKRALIAGGIILILIGLKILIEHIFF
ncbi:MAG: manganese efflux pump [Clostridiales bacterium]|jgi:putative Mn2+ efflux pump MntP|nr:manganese efflux pump [Clostridiales bacterium]